MSVQYYNLKKQNHLPPEWRLENLFIAALGLTQPTNAKRDQKLHVLPSWLCSTAELTRYALLYAYWASSMKIDLCLLSKQWIIHLNASNWSGWVFLLFPTYLLSLCYCYVQYVCRCGFMWKGIFKRILRDPQMNMQKKRKTLNGITSLT